MAEHRSPDGANGSQTTASEDVAESILTTPEDVASAGRSCMAIVLLMAVIGVVIAIWIVYGAVLGR